MISIIISIILSSYASAACGTYVSLDMAQKLISAKGMASVVTCDPVKDKCICADGVYWEVAEVVDGAVQNNQANLADFQSAQAKMNSDLDQMNIRKSQVDDLRAKLKSDKITDQELRTLLKLVL